jgi:hypothetical protein
MVWNLMVLPTAVLLLTARLAATDAKHGCTAGGGAGAWSVLLVWALAALRRQCWRAGPDPLVSLTDPPPPPSPSTHPSPDIQGQRWVSTSLSNPHSTRPPPLDRHTAMSEPVCVCPMMQMQLWPRSLGDNGCYSILAPHPHPPPHPPPQPIHASGKSTVAATMTRTSLAPLATYNAAPTWSS